MSNIFAQRQEYAQHPERSTFDLSHRNNFTTKIGQITPIFCMECMPGDSVQLKTDLGLRFSPLVFPIQTPLIASVKYFKVYHRAVWDEFEDFVGDTRDDIVHPYIDVDYNFHTTGSLYDYLGVPSTYSSPDIEHTSILPLYSASTTTRTVIPTISAQTSQTTGTANEWTPNDPSTIATDTAFTISYDPLSNTVQTLYAPFQFYDITINGNNYFFQASYDNHIELHSYLNPHFQYGNQPSAYGYISAPLDSNMSSSKFDLPDYANGSDFYVTFIYNDTKSKTSSIDYDSSWYWMFGTTYHYTLDSGTIYHYNNINPVLDPFLDELEKLTSKHAEVRVIFWQSYASASITPDGSVSFGGFSKITVKNSFVDDVDVSDSPFVKHAGEDAPAVRINALPARVYESIYNWHFRTNTQVDPFIKDGHPEYNKWCTNTSSGPDSTTPLDLKFRNYEMDYITTAVNTPQQGEAPLVGVSSTGTFTFEASDGTQYTAKAIIDDDGKLTGIDTYDPNLPQSSLHRLIDTITHGISINDFRNVSAFQAWKERNLRRGYRYKDQVMSHFGVDAKTVHYNDPEFLGGFSRPVNVNALTSTTQTTEINLGEYGGQASLFANSEHSITTYCDEHCFIMGVLTITPVPVYQQTLAPFLHKLNLFSYPFPEFSNLGYQAIPYKFISPVQSYILSKTSGENELEKTFGYQRPQWDLVARTDEAHGLMRTDFANFLLSRYFATPPQLGHDLLECNPSHLTNPFVDTDVDADQIIGQAYFDVSAQRCVSHLAIPRLEP